MHKKGGWRKVRAKSEKLGMFLGERCLFSWRKWQGKSERRKMQEYAIKKTETEIRVMPNFPLSQY